MSSQKIDCILPLTLRDYGRFKILFESIKKNFVDLGTFWVVVIDKEFEELNAAIQDDRCQVIKESSLVPEFDVVEQFNWKVPGWYKQQLIKLAIAGKVETDFYMTLDADVICVKPTYFADLVENGRAVCCLHSQAKSQKWQMWYVWAEKALKLKHNSGIFHNLTPAVLSTSGVIALQNYLSKNLSAKVDLGSFNKKEILFFALRSFLALSGKSDQAKLLKSWKSYLIKKLPWTEYALYYTFLEETGLFDQHHILERDRQLYSYENSVWNTKQWKDWQPEKAFDQNSHHHFCVIQSNAGLDPAEVWKKVSPYLAN